MVVFCFLARGWAVEPDASVFWEEAFLVLVTMGDVLVGGWGAAAGVVVVDDDDDADAKAELRAALLGLPLLLLALLML